MNPVLKQVLAGLLGGMMATGTAITTAIQENTISGITDSEWWVIGIGGFLSAAASWMTLLTKPPEKRDV